MKMHILSKIKREERMFFYTVLFRCRKKLQAKEKQLLAEKNQHLIQLLRTRIFGTGRATEIMYIMTVAPPARGELTIGNFHNHSSGAPV
jgi:hypothetical protein